MHGGVHYKQLNEVARGLTVSLVIADIFMDELEKNAFEELQASPERGGPGIGSSTMLSQ